MFKFAKKKLTFFTDGVWVANIACSTNTHSSVIVNLAFSIGSTNSGEARVLAFFLDACKVEWAFRIGCAFRLGC